MLASPHITDNIHPMGHRISHQNSRSQSSSLNQVPPHLSGSVRSTKPIDVKSKPAPLPQDYARDIKKHQEDMKRKAAHECNFRDILPLLTPSTSTSSYLVCLHIWEITANLQQLSLRIKPIFQLCDHRKNNPL